VQAPGLDQLGRLVVARIQVVDGVTRTLTCTCSIGSRVMRHRRPALCLVELRGFEPLTPCMPWPCGHLELPRLTIRSTTFPQVGRPSPRGDT
jgi:hypothetical protein